MTRREKIEWLKRYQVLVSRKNRILEEIQEAEQSAGPKSPKLDGMPHMPGSGGSAPELCSILLSLLTDEYNKIDTEIKNTRLEIMNSIKKLQHNSEYELLRKRYLSPEPKTWRVIASELHFSESWVRNLHLIALDNLEIPEYRDTILYGE